MNRRVFSMSALGIGAVGVLAILVPIVEEVEAADEAINNFY